MGRKPVVAAGVGERIASLYRRENRQKFSERLGVPDGTVAKYVRGEREPSSEFLTILRSRLGVDVNWILTGEEAPSNLLGLASSGQVRIPRYDVLASAGAGALVAAENQHGWMAVDRDWLSRYVSRSANVGVIEATGDSMSPTIRNRDLLLVDVRDGFTRQDLLRGGIYVLTLDGGLVVKRLGVDGNALVVTSDNPSVPAVRVPFEQLEARVKIHGIVFWAGGALETHR